ncbi:hydroxypyruvate isomerase, partial [Novosphingobium sediminicola]|nr:hydroxypyruvate isomerase [Novosphingobium sediminicola]
MTAPYQLSSCIEWQFADAGELDARLHAAKAAGFAMAEFHLWRDKPVDAIAGALSETGMRLTGICVDPALKLEDRAEWDKWQELQGQLFFREGLVND